MKIKYMMYNVQDNSALHNDAVCPVICDDWQFTHLWKVFAWPHHFPKRRYSDP